jgi:hypothetical protein
MRLLKCETKLLEDFFDHNRPRYAILSHTWDGVEVPFRDYYNPYRGTLYSAGANDKILQACAKARKDGFDYLWIDSTCIDKDSSAELTEAINSMYKWYEDAERCYVHLSDFELSRNYSTWYNPLCAREIEELASCRWFTRGWGEIQSKICGNCVG